MIASFIALRSPGKLNGTPLAEKAAMMSAKEAVL
jgi:hypothetical protein